MKRDVLNSPRLLELKKERRIAVLNKILMMLFGLSALFFLFAYLSQLDNLNIKEVAITGNKVIDTQIVQDTVNEKISGKYLWLFPKTNIMIYPKNEIIRTLNNKFKRLKDINLTIKDGKVLEVNLNERESKYTWCGEIIPILNSDSDQKCYFMDKEGYIFDEAPYFSGRVYFKFYGKTSFNGKSPVGFYFLQDSFDKIIAFKDIITEMGLDPFAFFLNNSGDANFALTKEPMLGPTIIFKLDSDFEQIAENLQAALNTEPLKTEFKNKYSSLQYIDLRFGNKVYNKFQ